MKTCSKCGEEKPLNDFYKDKSRIDGHTYICKTCHSIMTHKYRLENLDKFTATSYKWRKKHPLRLRESRKNYTNRYPEKLRAKNAARRLIRGCCEICGTTDNIHGHHDDYGRPLDVRWLCHKHHAELHRELREMERNNVA